MTIAEIRKNLGDYAKDIKLNLGSILTEEGATGLHQNQIYAVALACAYATKNKVLIQALESDSADILLVEEKQATKAAATIMAMNNIFYRFNHLVSDKDYMKMPAGLRMNVIGKPGVAKVDFELYCLAISAIEGCGMCIDAHVNVLITAGKNKTSIQSTIRIAAIINATATALEIA